MNSVYNSRKYRLALLGLLLIVTGWCFAGFFPGLAEVFGEYVTGISSVLFLYYTGNVSNKLVLNKYSKPDAQQ